MTRPTRAVIDLDALEHNARLLRQLAGQRQLMAVVKADAYGHGMVRCATLLGAHVDAVAVAFLEEAEVLRQSGFEAPILVLEGPLEGSEVSRFAELSLWSVVHQARQVEWFEAAAQRPDCLWLKVDTGMHRLGVGVNDVEDYLRRLAALEVKKIIVMSHLATAGDLSTSMARRQLQRWRELLGRCHSGDCALETSLLNSAAALLTENGSDNWLRPGYLFYGCLPDGLGQRLGVRPVMTLQSAVSALREVEAGEQVGYGGTWRAARTSRIATIPIGYADGYPRSAENGTIVTIDGHEAPLAGRVSMDMITVDVSDLHDVKLGARATLWGTTPTVDAVAATAGTIGYELTSRVTQRVPRHYTRRTHPSAP